MGNRLQKLFEVLFRERIILNITDFKAKRNRINLNWAPIAKRNGLGLVVLKKDAKQNFGDYLANPIYDFMLDKNGLDKNKKVKGTKHLYTIGSIILIGHQDATVWGSGILMGEPEGFIWARNRYRHLDVRCVRGPLTLMRLKENGIDVSKCKLGDPGVLMPLIYQPSITQKRDYGILIHMSERDNPLHKAEYDANSSRIIDIITDDYKKTIDEICSCNLIISSTLHGIIIAESYGIPAILLKRYEFDDFKYMDYYLSTGRKKEDVPMAESIEEALSMEVPKVPDLSVLRDNLLSSFPADLWL
jgi:pyruvyltransferase